MNKSRNQLKNSSKVRKIVWKIIILHCWPFGLCCGFIAMNGELPPLKYFHCHIAVDDKKKASVAESHCLFYTFSRNQIRDTSLMQYSHSLWSYMGTLSIHLWKRFFRKAILISFGHWKTIIRSKCYVNQVPSFWWHVCEGETWMGREQKGTLYINNNRKSN